MSAMVPMAAILRNDGRRRPRPDFFQKSLSKLEGNTRAAEILAWIRTPGLIWIENSVSAGDALWAWQMVVGDDKVET